MPAVKITLDDSEFSSLSKKSDSLGIAVSVIARMYYRRGWKVGGIYQELSGAEHPKERPIKSKGKGVSTLNAAPKSPKTKGKINSNRKN